MHVTEPEMTRSQSSRQRLRVVFMGTPEFAVPALRACIEEHEVVAVYSQPDRPSGRGMELKAPPVKAFAIERGIRVHQPLKLSIPGEYETLAALRPDVIVVVAYGQILRRNVLDLPRLGCINVHASLLPRWRGAAPINWAILAGDARTGVTTMRMVEKLDAGAMLLTESLEITPRMTAGELHDRLSEMGGRMIGPTLQGLAEGSLRDVPQLEAQVTYASKLGREMERLDPHREGAVELDRRVRALSPWPGTSVLVQVDGGATRLKIKAANPLAGGRGVSAGEIGESAGMAVLGTRSGLLMLERVQWDGKREMSGAESLNGLRGRKIALPLKIVAVEETVGAG